MVNGASGLESNWRPSPYKGVAATTELQRHVERKGELGRAYGCRSRFSELKARYSSQRKLMLADLDLSGAGNGVCPRSGISPHGARCAITIRHGSALSLLAVQVHVAEGNRMILGCQQRK